MPSKEPYRESHANVEQGGGSFVTLPFVDQFPRVLDLLAGKLRLGSTLNAAGPGGLHATASWVGAGDGTRIRLV